VEQLQAEKKSLSEAVQSMREDYLITGSELIFLKFQWSAIEQVAAMYAPQGTLDAAFEKALVGWDRDWENVMDRYCARKQMQQRSKPSPSGSLAHSKSFSQPSLPRFNAEERALTFPRIKNLDVSQEQSKWPELENLLEDMEAASSEKCTCKAAQRSSRIKDVGAATQSTDSSIEKPRPGSRWSAFWCALTDAAGIIDYDELFHDEE